MKFITVALLALIVVSANAFARIRHLRDIDTEQWQKQIDQYVSESTTPEDLKEKVSDYYSKLTEKQGDFVKFYRKQCTSWIKSVASDEEKAELKALYENKDGDVLAGKINDYINRLSENERAPVLLWKNTCAYLWNIDIPVENIASRVRRSTTTHNILSTEWLTDDQSAQLSGLEGDEYDKKYLSFFKELSGDAKHSASTKIVKKCYGWLEEVATQEERDELKDLHHKDHSKCKEKVQEYLGRVPEAERSKIKEHLDVCEEVWYAEHNHGHEHHHHHHRRRRHHEHSFEDFAKEHLGWLSDDQKAEVMKIKDDKAALKAKMNEFFEATSGEKRNHAVNSMKGACRQLLKHVLGDEKAAELKTMRESGASVESLKTKFEEYLNGITDEHLKEEANDHKDDCMKMFMTPSRKRRDHHHGHKLEDYLKTHLSWLTTEQGEALKQMKADGKNPSELQKKVFEFYESTTGETREKATELLKGGCRDLIKAVVGDEKAEELKKLKESGASDSEVSDKIKSYIAKVEDPQKKELAVSYEGACKKIFGVGSRKRRDHAHGHKLEDYLKTHLSWLTAEQGETLKQMKADGKNPSELQKKVFEFYEATTGGTKEKATELLKGGCRDLIKAVVGDEKAEELKKLRESGASNTEISDKIKEYVAAVEDPQKKELAVSYEGACKKIFGVESRKRRDHHHGHKLEDYLKTHLSWLTSEQAETLKQMKTDNKSPEEMQKKVFEFYESTTGETRAKATELLQGGCRDLIQTIVEQEKAAELKTMKESGASVDEINAKVKEFVGEIQDEEKKQLASKYEGACKKIFGVQQSRKRREHNHDDDEDLEEFAKNHLTWLSDEQRQEVTALKDSGKDAIKAKINEFYKAATGETKAKATVELQNACHALIDKVVGEEHAAILKGLRDSGADIGEIQKKVDEFLGQVTDEQKRKLAQDHREGCAQMFLTPPSRRRRDKHHEHTLKEFVDNHLTWLNAEQKAQILELDGQKEAVKTKINEFFEKTSGEEREKAVSSFQAACRERLIHVIGDEKAAELKTMRESGASNEALMKKTEELLAAVEDETLRKEADEHKEDCLKVFGIKSRKIRDCGFDTEKHLTWLTDDQQATLTQMKAEKKAPQDIHKKIFEFYDATTGETRTKAKELMQGGCRDVLKHVLGEEKTAELKALKESGASNDEMSSKIKDMMDEIDDPKKKDYAVAYEGPCKRIFGVETRKRRDHHHGHKLEDYLKTHLSWLTSEQAETLKQMKTDNKSPEEMQKKVFEFYEATTGETRAKATELLQGGCRDLIQTIVGQEKAAELKTMKESGASVDEINAKVKEFVGEIQDEEKKQLASKYEGACKKIFGVQQSRKRRDHHHGHKLEDYLKTHLSWLTAEQGETLKKMKADGKNPSELQKKVFEFYESTTGETREKATELLKGGCRDLIKAVVGDEKAEELKKLKESGASDSEVSDKIKSYIAKVEDPQKKELAVSYEGACKKIFGVGSRKRRDHAHGHKLEDYLKTHLSWLTAEQGETLKQMKADGKNPSELQKKVFEFYEATTGGTKEKATELLKGGCRDLIKAVVGDEKAEELKKLRESGASNTEISDKIKEYVAAVEDPQKKELAVSYEGACKKIFGVESRKRRDHHHGHKLEDYLKTHLSWLTSEQAETLKQMKTDNKSPEEMQKKVFEFYEATTGETRAKATELLQGGCRDLIQTIVGQEKAAELKTMKESGASVDEINAKVKEFVGEIQDEEKKQLASKYEGACKKIFGVQQSRKRRDHHHGHKLEDYLKTHLSWLTAEQGETLKKMKADGKNPSELQKKVFEFYESTTGETREKATELLKGGCRDLIKAVVGDEKAEELKKLKESGASDSEVSDKIKSYIAEVEDSHKKELAVSYEGACKKIFGVGSRKRRHEGKHGIDDFVDNHLSWLNAEQKTEIDKLKVEGNFAGIKARVNTFYDTATGETKEKATEELKGACRELYTDILGDKANEVKALKESGASDSEVSKKIDELVAGVTDEAKKAKAQEYKDDCKKIYGVQSRKRRTHDHGEHDLEDYFKNHYSWLSEDQKNELRQMKKDGKKDDIWNKALEFYDAATGETRTKAEEQMKGGCRELIRVIVGNEKADELTAMRESGASIKDMDAKLQEFVSGVTDVMKKNLSETYGPGCRRVFGVAPSRKRREHDHGEHKLEDYFKTHFNWLTEEQKNEMRQLKTEGKKAPDLYGKALEYYEAATGEVKEKAKEQMKGGCRELIRVIVGNEKADELTAMRESGASLKDMDAKLQEFVGQITDEGKKTLATTYGPGCRKIFGVESRRRRSHDHGEHDLEDYFKNHYSWLSEDQKNELRQMKKDGKKDDIWNKALEFYDAATGETRTKAEEQMKGGCRELIRVIVGNEKADELTAMRESGASIKDMDAKLQEFVSGVTDVMKKNLSQTYGPGCRKVFGVDSRMRRSHDHGEHKLEDYFKSHFSWLNDAQKDELRQLKTDGKKAPEIYNKVLEYFEAATGEVKEKAKEAMQGGCRELIRVIVGNEKADELTSMKESGTDMKTIDAKLQEFIGEVTDEGKKTLASTYGPGCRQVFGVAPSRKRREHDHGEHKLEDYFKSHFSWLNDDQKDELRQLKTDGKKAPEIYNKVLEYFEAATGEVKEKAKEAMQGGCRELIRVIVGNEKADELTSMKESGTDMKTIDAKLQEFIGEVTDEGKKTLASTYGPGCRQVFGVAPSRKRREHDHGEHKLEDYFKSHFSWLNDDQKDELRQLKTDGKKAPEIYNKVLEYFEAATGEVKEKAKEAMQGGCRELIRVVIGNQKADELTVLKESGASVKALDSKLHEFLRDVTDEGKNTLATTYGPGCRKVFGLPPQEEKRKRRAFRPSVTHMNFIRAVVGNEDKPAPSHRALTYQIMDIYDGEKLSERARNVVNQCHGLFGEIIEIAPYKNENSVREVLHSLRSASDRQLKGIQAVAEVCKKTVEELEETQGNHGSIGRTLIEMFKNLDDEPRDRLREQWKSKCLDWIIDVTDADEREDLKYFLRMGRIEVVQERVTELMARFDDKTRTQVGHMRPVCENLLGFVHSSRKTFHRKVPVETVF